MKNFVKLTLSCLGLALTLAACGKNDGGGSTAATPTCQAGYVWNGSACVYSYGYNYNCPSGQVQTQYGCLPQCPGNPTYGQMTNGQCVPPVATYPGYSYGPQYGWPYYGVPYYGWGTNCRFVMKGGFYYYYCY